jgi:hypothetical protein
LAALLAALPSVGVRSLVCGAGFKISVATFLSFTGGVAGVLQLAGHAVMVTLMDEPERLLDQRKENFGLFFRKNNPNEILVGLRGLRRARELR